METEVCAPPQAGKPERAKLELSSSPPPNCAICLSDCDNKSFTDKCMHQFCFACLLKWSKVKAECPLCKQPFTSIIHNVRSSNDYEEFAILNHQTSQTAAEEFNDDLADLDTFLLPNVAANSQLRQRRFQYRTTLFLDPTEDVAIQRMLLTHPLTNTVYVPGRRLSRMFRSSVHYTDLDFRNAIYLHNWWVIPSSPDVTGVYRNCSPQFFRENPAQLHRVQPWLMRELNALLNHNMPHTLYILSIIKNLLTECHVESLEFRNRIHPYFRERTDHFIHEFYNFLRSPYDMAGYDRFCQYSQRIPAVELYSSSSSSDDDSDVEIISTQHPSIEILETPPVPTRPLPTEVIEVSDSDSNNSDVILQEPPPPPIITIDDSDEEPPTNNAPEFPQACVNSTIPELKTEKTDEENSNVATSTCHVNKNESEESIYPGEDSGDNSDNWGSNRSSSSRRNKRKRVRASPCIDETRSRSHSCSSSTSSGSSSTTSSSDSSSRSYSRKSTSSPEWNSASKSKKESHSHKRVKKSRSLRQRQITERQRLTAERQRLMTQRSNGASTSTASGYKMRFRANGSGRYWYGDPDNLTSDSE